MILKQSGPPHWSPGIKDTIKGLVTLISIVVPKKYRPDGDWKGLQKILLKILVKSLCKINCK